MGLKQHGRWRGQPMTYAAEAVPLAVVVLPADVRSLTGPSAPFGMTFRDDMTFMRVSS